MAIDTERKRRSSMNVGLYWLRPLPVADGNTEPQDRSHYMTLYAYDRLGGAAPPSTGFAGIGTGLVRIAMEGVSSGRAGIGTGLIRL